MHGTGKVSYIFLEQGEELASHMPCCACSVCSCACQCVISSVAGQIPCCCQQRCHTCCNNFLVQAYLWNVCVLSSAAVQVPSCQQRCHVAAVMLLPRKLYAKGNCSCGGANI
jgi:hypothetical protein